MSIINLIKEKVKQIARKVGGTAEKPEPAFANIKIYENDELTVNVDTVSGDLSKKYCRLIEYFARYKDYNIIFNYVEREIYIYFTFKTKKVKEDKK